MPKTAANPEKKNRSKRWSIVAFAITIFWAFVIQSVLDASLNSDTVQANILQDRSTAREAFKISNLYDVFKIESGNNYVSIGERDKEVFAFAVRTFSETLTLSEVNLKISGNIDSEAIKKLQLFEGERVIASTYTMRNNAFAFKNFTSVLQPNSYKEYVIKMDVSDEAHSGTRFKFEISGPNDITIKKDGVPIHALDAYPLKGDYTTIVGWKK